MRFFARLRTVVVLSMLVTPIGIGITAGPASAVGCHGAGCRGKDPVVMGCAADAVSVNRTVFDDRASGGTFGRQVVTLRYSRRCNASWSRVTASAGGTAHVTRSVAYMGGYLTSTKRTRNGAGSVYSKMRSGAAVDACGRTTFNNGAVVETHCAGAG